MELGTLWPFPLCSQAGMLGESEGGWEVVLCPFQTHELLPPRKDGSEALRSMGVCVGGWGGRDVRRYSLSDATLWLQHPESEDLLKTGALAPCLPHPSPDPSSIRSWSRTPPDRECIEVFS